LTRETSGVLLIQSYFRGILRSRTPCRDEASAGGNARPQAVCAFMAE
jgi:hypothetical protein